MISLLCSDLPQNSVSKLTGHAFTTMLTSRINLCSDHCCLVCRFSLWCMHFQWIRQVSRVWSVLWLHLVQIWRRHHVGGWDWNSHCKSAESYILVINSCSAERNFHVSFWHTLGKWFMWACGIVSLSVQQCIHSDRYRVWQHMRKFWSEKMLTSWLVRCWLTAEIKFESMLKSCMGKRWNLVRAVTENYLRYTPNYFVWVDAEIVFEQSLKTSSYTCWIHVWANAVNFVVQRLNSLKSCACECWLKSCLILRRLEGSLVWVDETITQAPASQLSAGTASAR